MLNGFVCFFLFVFCFTLSLTLVSPYKLQFFDLFDFLLTPALLLLLLNLILRALSISLSTKLQKENITF